MKKQLLLGSALLLLLQAGAQQLPTELQTPDIVSENRLPMRASAFAFESRELAAKKQKEQSGYFISMNGDWNFNWVQDRR